MAMITRKNLWDFLCHKNRRFSTKAIFFTLDSLLASGIVIVSILLISNFYSSQQQSVNVNYASQDLARVFSTMGVGEVNNDYVKSLIASGDITNANNTILEQIGDFWTNDELNLSYNFTKNLTDDVIPSNYGVSILVNGEEIYSRNIPVKRALVSSRKIISGIAKAKPTEGFTARVLLSGIKSKRTNAYAYFGGYEGDGNLTKKLILPKDVSIFNSSYLEVDAGGNFNLYINGFYSGSYAKGSGGGGNMLADKWNLSNAYLANFKAGENIINISFASGSSYIAGGFLRVTYVTSSYNDTQIPGYSKEYLPGIDGVINLYSSFYSPSNLNSMGILLHFISPYQLYLNIGNTTVFESNGSSGEQQIILNNSNLSATLDYTKINDKTVPIRMGLKVLSYGQGSKSDAILITDRTGSMSSCDVNVNCTAGLCDSNPTGGCHDRRDNVAIKSDKKFIDSVVGIAGNNVGLVGFGESLQPYCDIHPLSSDNVSLKYQVSNYSNAFCGYTCISCGIVEATELLTEQQTLYGLDQTYLVNTTQFTVGDAPNPVSIKEIFPIAVNKTKLIKSKLTIFGRSVNVNGGYYQCVYLNNNYIGRMCDSIADWHTCSFPLKPDWFSNSSTNNITITGGTTSGCNATLGTNDNWDFKDVRLTTWQNKNSQITLAYNYSNKTVTVGDAPYPNIASVNFSLNVDNTKIKSASIEFEAINVTPSYFDCVFINENYVGRVDYQKWNGTNVWQKVLFDVPAVWVKNGINKVNISSGTTSGCIRTSGTNNQWSFRNLNLSFVSSDEGTTYDRLKSMLVMSDGDANTKIGDCAGCDSAGARNETITKACEAHNLYGIGIYSVVFGNPGAVSLDTLNETACCDDCSHFYTANSSDSLLDVYTQIAQSIINIGFSSQTVNITGGNIQNTKLYPDSFIEVNYTPLQDQFNKIPIAFETDRFNNNISNGALYIYPNTSVLDAKATSYSSNKWTDNLVVNGNNVYRLSDYGNNYQILGDPFAVNIPVSSINIGNNGITISTGVNSTTPTGGSNDSKVLYTLLLNGFADYSSVVGKSNGCSWNVAFEDDIFSTIRIPPTYAGTDPPCSYTPLSITYDANDALDNAVFQLLSNLDIDKDGKLDVNIAENNIDVSTLTISKVPSLWGPAIIEVRVWE